MDLDEARRMALALMQQHHLYDWTFAFDNAKTRAGICRPARLQIGLSRHLTALHDPAEVRDTVLHEIAHALVGTRHGHDRVWRAKALSIGCSGVRCMSVESAKVQGGWQGACPAGHEFTAHRRPQRVRSCSRCSSAFDLNAIISWTRDGEPAEMLPAYRAELAALLAGPGEPRIVGPRLPAGARVRLSGGGIYGGRTGTIVAARRTRYVVRLDGGGRVTAPFELVHT